MSKQNTLIKTISTGNCEIRDKTFDNWNHCNSCTGFWKSFILKNLPQWICEISSIQSNILSKLMHLIYMLDFASIYLAVKNKIEPTPIKSIDFFKKRLSSE